MPIMCGIISPTLHVHIPVQVSLMSSNLLLQLKFKSVMELPKFWFFKCFLVEQCYTSPWTDSIKLFNGGPWKSTTWGGSSFSTEAPMHSSFSSLALWQSLIMVELQSFSSSFRFCFIYNLILIQSTDDFLTLSRISILSLLLLPWCLLFLIVSLLLNAEDSSEFLDDIFISPCFSFTFVLFIFLYHALNILLF